MLHCNLRWENGLVATQVQNAEQLIAMHPCYTYLLFINVSDAIALPQPVPNVPPPLLICYTKLLSCYTKLFRRVVTADKLLCITIEVFCPLKCFSVKCFSVSVLVL